VYLTIWPIVYKKLLNWLNLMSVEDIASQSIVVFETRYTAWLKRHNCRGIHVNVSHVVQKHQLWWHDKSPFDSMLSRQHLFQKLSKSVDVRWSYIVQHRCRFLRHSVDERCRVPSVIDKDGAEGALSPDFHLSHSADDSWKMWFSQLFCVTLLAPSPFGLWWCA